MYGVTKMLFKRNLCNEIYEIRFGKKKLTGIHIINDSLPRRSISNTSGKIKSSFLNDKVKMIL